MKFNEKYFVVRFLEKPYSTIDSEVCVPFKWLKLAKKTTEIVSVAYPDEYLPSTRGMVRDIHTQGDEWRYYKVQVKCVKRSFKAAERYIKSRNQIKTESETTECSNTEINESKSAFNKNCTSSNQSSSPSLATKNPILRNNRSDPIKLSIKRSMPNISLNDLFKKPTKTVTTSELISETPNHTNGSGKNFNVNKLVSLDLDCLNQEQHDTTGKQSLLVTQDQLINEQRHPEKHIGKPSELNYTEKSIYFQNYTNNETSSVQSTSNTNHTIKKSCKKNHLLSYEHDKHEQFSLNSEDFSDQEMPTEEIAAEKMSENNHIETTTCPEMNTNKQESKVNLCALINTSSELKSIVEESLLIASLKSVQKIHHTNDEFLVRNTFGELNEAIEQMLKEIDRCLTVQQNNITESISQEQQVKPEEKLTENENKKSNNLDLNYFADDSDDDADEKDDSNDSDFCVDNKYKDDTDENDDDDDESDDDDDENDDSLCEPPKKTPGKKRSFVLPPEYNAHDSRWTLKYQAIEPGVVELVPHSKIYISDLKLANCKRIARDYKAFGRTLLVEIFSRNALSVCSLTGARANAFDVHDSDIRPGLDEEARSILLTYVEEYGRNQGWGQYDTQSVVNSLRSKIQLMRSKYGSTV